MKKNNKTKSVNFRTQLENAIKNIFTKYELWEGYYVLTGLDLVGFDNYEFWMNVVEQIERYKGFECLPVYISIMEQMERYELLALIEVLKTNKKYSNIEISYMEFVDILSKISNIGNKEMKKTI